MFRAAPGSFDLVLTDQTMPNMTGLMLAQEILKIWPDMPVIVSSGNYDIIAKAKDTDSKECLIKPYEMHEIGKTIRKVLDT